MTSNPESAAAAPAFPMQPAFAEAPTQGRFSGKTIIVTGAGGGIGKATASRILREGGRVIGVDIVAPALEALAAEFEGHDLVTVTANISDDADIARVVEAAGETIDGLANVAGVMDDVTPVGEVSDAMWSRVFTVNVEGVMKLMRAVVPGMAARGKGAVVNVASEAGIRGSAAGVAYTASKHAVVGITKSSAFMYAPDNLRINAIAPGGVATGMTANTSQHSEIGTSRTRSAMGILPPLSTAEMQAAAITFLLSDDAPNINGIVMPTDGGWSAT